MEREDPTNIIALWLSEFPKNQVPRGDRVGHMVNLIDEFKRFGYGKEEFKSGPLFRKIVKSCMNENLPNQTKRRIWGEMVEKDLEIAVAKVFREEIKANQVPHTEESQKKLDEQKSAPANDIVRDESAKPYELPPPSPNQLDHSIFKDEPTFDVTYDEEALILLGFKK